MTAAGDDDVSDGVDDSDNNVLHSALTIQRAEASHVHQNLFARQFAKRRRPASLHSLANLISRYKSIITAKRGRTINTK